MAGNLLDLLVAQRNDAQRVLDAVYQLQAVQQATLDQLQLIIETYAAELAN